MLNKITAVIVSYNTPELLKACYNSIRKFYPELELIVIDGSPPDSDCWTCSRWLGTGENITVKNVEYNIGHGKGMHMGIGMAKTDYVLLIDSDVTIDYPNVLEEMAGYLSIKNCYGVGQIVEVNEHGSNVSAGIKYLHPHFAMISKVKYCEYANFINHGAPLIKAMLECPPIYNFNVQDYITHKGRGTRKQNPKEFNPANWEKIK